MNASVGLIIFVLAVVGVFSLIYFFIGIGSYFVADRDKVIFNLKSEGRKLADWPNKLLEKHFLLSGAARQIFMNSEETPTEKIFGVVILKLKDVNLLAVRDIAAAEDLLPATVEVAALARDRISDQDLRRMGLDAIIIMHLPVHDYHLSPQLLMINRKSPNLSVTIEKSREFVGKKIGFLFLIEEPIIILDA